MNGLVKAILPEVAEKIDASSADHPWLAACFNVATTLLVLFVVIPIATVELILKRIARSDR